VATPESLPTLLSVDPMQEKYTKEKLFQKITQYEEVLEPAQIQRCCALFNVRSLDRSDVAVVKVIIMPHPESPSARSCKFYYNDAMEVLLGQDFEDCTENLQDLWTRIKSPKAPKLCPIFWGMLTDESMEKIVNYYMEFATRTKRVDLLEIRNASGNPIPCCSLWESKVYDALEIPESVTMTFRVLSVTYDPFHLPDQGELLRSADEISEFENTTQCSS
jgi:hypothetical protein